MQLTQALSGTDTVGGRVAFPATNRPWTMNRDSRARPAVWPRWFDPGTGVWVNDAGELVAGVNTGRGTKSLAAASLTPFLRVYFHLETSDVFSLPVLLLMF